MRTEVEIIPYRDGPYLVRGDFRLRDQDGETIDVSRSTIALCRCGKSRIRPFCDGTHRLIRFRAPSPAERPHDRPPDGHVVTSSSAEPISRGGNSSVPVDGTASRSDAASWLTSARDELRRTTDSVGRSLQHPNSPEGYLALRAAEPLIAAACAMITEKAERGVGASRALKAHDLAPCLCLLRGALGALQPPSRDLEQQPVLRRFSDRLRFVVQQLERGAPSS